ncbi:MAG TPA: glycosyltransferase family 1 protein [Segetibacter sp.]|jgi:glycosyltransferase involved in cell wall biosynthesis
MKKTIYLNGRFLTQQLSGVQRSAFEVIKALDNLIDENLTSDQYDFILLYSGELRGKPSFKHIKLQCKGLLKGNLWEQFELPVYTGKKLLISLCSISTLFKKNQLVLVHDASFFINKHFFSKAFGRWYRYAIPRLAKTARHIITVSNFSKSELLKYCDIKPEGITVIYNSAEHLLNVEEPGDEFKERIKKLKPYCLAVSNIAANKNFGGLSVAINKVNFSQYKMLIAGGQLSSLAYAPPSSTATYLGYVTDQELRYLYKNASLFIFPSFYEGFGIPPLEAMISGCPVIASNTSSLPEVLGDASAYFNPADTDDMAKEIELLLNDNERLETLRIKGFEQASRYSWKNSAQKLYDLIETYGE